MLSIVLLNRWRQDNVHRLVRAYSAMRSIVSSVTVWSIPPGNYQSDEARCIVCFPDWGMSSRFIAALMASSSSIACLDDDLFLPDYSLRELLKVHEATPDIIVGIDGRRVGKNGAYEYVGPPGEVEIVLGRCTVFHKRYAVQVLSTITHDPEVAKLALHDEFTNCEDILLSYVATRSTGLLNRIVKVYVEELPAYNAQCARQGHYEYRERAARELKRLILGI